MKDTGSTEILGTSNKVLLLLWVFYWKLSRVHFHFREQQMWYTQIIPCEGKEQKKKKKATLPLWFLKSGKLLQGQRLGISPIFMPFYAFNNWILQMAGRRKFETDKHFFANLLEVLWTSEDPCSTNKRTDSVANNRWG